LLRSSGRSPEKNQFLMVIAGGDGISSGGRLCMALSGDSTPAMTSPSV
jgi:hypothetical protein